MESVQKNIENRISRFKKGELIFPADFRGLGSTTAIKMALSRLTTKGKLRRLSHGIYYRPKMDALFGELYPNPEKVAQAVAQKEKVRIMPTGSEALHALGLTTQVPVRRIYLTDGENRQIKMGKTYIEFKHTTPKKMSYQGKLSSLIILALMEIGTESLSDEVLKKLKHLLLHENKSVLVKDLAMAPTRIYDFIIKLIAVGDDQMVKPDR
ncbi:DUF6088 family protein [Chitinophaga sp. HK235]|uniref:DUF6088 family protein n=1 Tax=Chitinophaga sp. HK235 TaxID=2952571 RepID=UPI001BA855AD|nr:DUF6088 family protein [Chitinophaga sp. HK235]